MTVYAHRSFERGLWTVGHYDPSGKFHPDSDHDDEDQARRRVAQLNGGGDDGGGALAQAHSALASACNNLLDLWPMEDYELIAYLDATFIPAIAAALHRKRRR